MRWKTREMEALYNSKFLERRKEYAKQGRYIPSVDDLFMGCPWFLNDQKTDLAIYVARILKRHGDFLRGNCEALYNALQDISLVEEVIHVGGLEMAIRLLTGRNLHIPQNNRGFLHQESVAARLKFHSVYFGDNEHLDYIVKRMLVSYHTADDDLIRLVLFQHITGLVFNNNNGTGHQKEIDLMISFGEGTIETAIRNRAKVIEQKEQKRAEDKIKSEENTPELIDSSAGRIILTSIGGAVNDRSSAANKDFEPILNKVVPFKAVPHNLAKIQDKLNQEFPHAAKITSVIFNSIKNGGEILYFRPVILVGAAGSGKSAYAKRLFELFEIPCAVYSCAGVHDGTFGGTARSWSSGQAALPTDFVKRHMLINPGIILDEIEKGGTSTHNGRFSDTILSFLEPSNSSTFHDPYIMSRIDLSYVLYIATANSIDGLSAPLRDRCRILDFPTPAPEHLPALVSGIIKRIRDERELSDTWLPALDGEELEAIEEIWRGGSIRQLRRLIEGVLQARDDGDIALMN